MTAANHVRYVPDKQSVSNNRAHHAWARSPDAAGPLGHQYLMPSSLALYLE
jgi:hypothetical protein